MKNKIKKIGRFFGKHAGSIAVAAVGLMVPGMVKAAAWIDVSSLEVDTAPVATLGLTILAALAAMWVLRKLIKTTNRS